MADNTSSFTSALPKSSNVTELSQHPYVVPRGIIGKNERSQLIPFERKRPLLVLQKREVDFLGKIANSRTEPYAKVRRARMLLAYSRGERILSIARREQTNRPKVERCIDKVLSAGIMTALRDLPRPGRPAVISDEDKAWVLHVACSKPTEYG
ncbi:MAG: hypothetical protein DRG83_07580, partial [Deltaproteobacteria bacterium]